MTTNNQITNVISILHIEVEYSRSRDSDFVRTDLLRDEATAWILKSYTQLRVGQELVDSELDNDIPLGCVIHSIKVVDYTGPKTPDTNHVLDNARLDVQAFELHPVKGDEPPSSPLSDDDELGQLRAFDLPNRAFDGLWEALVWEDNLASRLLRVITRTLSLMKNPKLNASLNYWNKLLLLYGPPGSGKSTLAKAIAQKLSIRLGRHYSKSKLVEVNTSNLLSKYFGESSKLIGKMFDKVQAMADNETSLIVVLIDEVETLTSSRENAVNGNECGDAIRATNQVLMALDRLRDQPNTIVICTSNLVDHIDNAFLDRVDLKQAIPLPNAEGVYEIFRTSLNDLIRCDVLLSRPATGEATFHDGDGEFRAGSLQLHETGSPATIPPEDLLGFPSRSSGTGDVDVGFTDNFDSIPDLGYVRLNLWNHPESTGCTLLRIAQKARNMSGRTLRRLPLLALTQYTFAEPCDIHEALAALDRAVEDEIRANNPDIVNELTRRFPPIVLDKLIGENG